MATRVGLLVVAILALGLAFFTPIATYKPLDVSAVETFVGGQQGLDSIAEEITYQLDRYITENPEQFASQVIAAGGEDICQLGICTWISHNSQAFANSVSERLILPGSTAARAYLHDNYQDLLDSYQSYTADIPLMAEKSSNVFSVAQSLWQTQTYLLFALVAAFAITTPVLKILVAALQLIVQPKGLVGALWTLIGKLSMIEVFALASIVTAYSGLPLVQITPGWWAVAGYAIFTIAILLIDVLPPRPLTRLA